MASVDRVGWGLVALVLLSVPVRGEFRAGAAAVNINPPAGIPLAGYYSERGSQGTIDDLFAKALVFDDGARKIALVVCDLISLPRHTVVETRRLIEEATDIPGVHVMLSATHSHTGPVISRESARDQLDGGDSALSREYTAQLPARIARAVGEAHARLAPAAVSFAREFEHRLAFNRRFWMKDGTVGWNPGKLNGEIIRPVGPIDPEVGVVYLESADSKPMATYVNFAMHPDTTGGTRVSADYPAALARRLAEYKGADMLTLFANGTCGDLNHVNVRWAARQTSPEEANRLGTILAAAVFKAYMDLAPVTNLALRVKHEIVRLPVPRVVPEEVEQARQEVRSLQADTRENFMKLVQAYKVLDVMGRDGKPWEVEVQAVALGRELAWVSLPGEVFVDLGLSIKAASPFRQTHIAELANGSIGYIPNRSAYAQGAYEVVSARCAEGSGEMLVGAAVRLLNELHAASWN